MNSKKIKIVVLLLGIMVIAGITGCFKPVEKVEEEKAVAVDFHYYQTEEGEEYAVIVGLDQEQEPVWEVETAKNSLVLTTEVQDIGMRGDTYYYQSSEGVFAVNVSDGKELWNNKEVQGDHFVWDEDGNLYMCGMMAPEFSAVDADGNTLCVIQQFGEEYRWPSEITIEDGSIMVKLMVDTGDVDYETVCVIDMNDFSYDIAKG